MKVDVYPRDMGTAETTPDATPTPSSLELELESSRYLLAKHEEESALRSKQLVAALRNAERSRAVAVDAEARAQRLACRNDELNAVRLCLLTSRGLFRPPSRTYSCRSWPPLARPSLLPSFASRRRCLPCRYDDARGG